MITLNTIDTIEINQITLSDLENLQQISLKTFSETFSTSTSAENMQKYLDERLSLAKLASELNNSDSEFYFALHKGEIIGYLKLNTGMAQTEIQDDNALEIERIYVLKEFHGKRIGQLLFDKAIQIALQKGAEYVWLGVWEENLRAISFYQKNGFETFDKHLFTLGNDEQTDLMMKKRIN